LHNSKNNKVLIVGAGLAGATLARILAENNIKVEVIDKRKHIAGNIYDFTNSNNELIHKYGPHLLHCRKDSIALSFLSKFTEWVPYKHKVRALLSDKRTTPIPVNAQTLGDIFNKKFENEDQVVTFLNNIRNKEIEPKNSDELFEYSVGNELANIFFRPYTKKMWGIDPKNLSTSIGARIPVRTDYNDCYFNDEFQALPKFGYTKIIKNILLHENITISLNTNFKKSMQRRYSHSFLCVPIDEYYDFAYGRLPYRSIKFFEKLKSVRDQETAVINYTNNSKYTRKTQWSLFPNSGKPLGKFKTFTYELPCSIQDNPGEYYYPIHTKESIRLYQKYLKLSKKNKEITFCGRTGLFKYIDMIPCVMIHLEIAQKYLKNR